jgi:uncharacterized membrane protein
MGFSQKTRKRFTTFFFVLILSIVFALLACVISIPIRGCGPQIIKRSATSIKERRKAVYEKIFGHKPPSHLSFYDKLLKIFD